MTSPKFSISYGVEGKYLDVTEVALSLCAYNKTLRLPAGDGNRAMIFGDPLPGVLKHLRFDKGDQFVISPSNEEIIMHLSDIDHPSLSSTDNPRSWFDNTITDSVAKLELIHKNIKFIGGNVRDEYPEQLMAVMFIKEDAKVLELGSNIGRNTLTIATLLSDSNNLVTLECDPGTCTLLRQNLHINGYTSPVEDSALSYRKLIQKGWDTIPSDVLLPGYTPVKSITFQELEAKYNIKFDTLVADCEGALYYILLDYSNMLNDIHTIIMENDYHDINHKIVVDAIIKNKGFTRIYFRAGGWGPCQPNFFEVWQKV